MRIVVAPDSFKGTMSAMEVCGIIENAVLKCSPHAEVVKIPVADGGEGTVEAYLEFAGGERVYETVTGPDFKKVKAFYGILEGSDTAVVEMAAASGLPLIRGQKDPMHATTLGTGELIVSAAKRGCKRIILGMGGSATMDGGMGMATAFGIRFLDAGGKEVESTAYDLGSVADIDTTGMVPELRDMEFLLASDVKNKLCGENGAAFVFGPQKGASHKELEETDAGLAHFAQRLKEKTGKDLADVEGAGAAGGLALPLLAFLDAKIVPGIDLVLDVAEFEDRIASADMVVTGEGRVDRQSLEGKVPVGVARRAVGAGVPVIVLAGCLGEGYEEIYNEGVRAVLCTNAQGLPFEQIKIRAKDDLALLAESVFAFLESGGKIEDRKM